MTRTKQPAPLRRRPLQHLEVRGDAPRVPTRSTVPIKNLNTLVSSIAVAVKKQRKKVAAHQHAVRRQQQKMKAWSDAKFYTVLVFDAGNQCEAFIEALKANPHVSLEGDLFLDGRHIADAFGIPLPEPDYELSRQSATSGRRRNGSA